MMYVFYKTGDKIVQHHSAPNGVSEVEMLARVKTYNAANGPKGKTAFLQEVQEGSVEAYLLECLDKKYRFRQGELREAKNAVENARSCLECLEMDE